MWRWPFFKTHFFPVFSCFSSNGVPGISKNLWGLHHNVTWQWGLCGPYRQAWRWPFFKNHFFHFFSSFPVYSSLLDLKKLMGSLLKCKMAMGSSYLHISLFGLIFGFSVHVVTNKCHFPWFCDKTHGVMTYFQPKNFLNLLGSFS